MLLLIDGDVIAYMACDWKSGNETFDEDGEDTSERDEEYLNESWKSFKKIMSEIREELWADDFLMAVKSSHNFRDTLYPDYKRHRKQKEPTRRNKAVPKIRDLAVQKGYAIESINCEADDFLRIWATQAQNTDEDYCIVSIDKDLFCIPGQHYNPFKKELKRISNLEASRHFYEQLLKGDQVDNIPGIHRIGPKTAQRILASCINTQEMQEAVVNMYIEGYGDSWYDMLLSNGKMLYLKKFYGDYFQISHWEVVKELMPLYIGKLKPKKAPVIVDSVVSTTATNSVKRFKIPVRP